MRKRLLHKGANTMQIIDVYISTIKVGMQDLLHLNKGSASA